MSYTQRLSDMGDITFYETPVITTWSTSMIYNYAENGRIDLDPSFQRGVVWPAKTKSTLIDSLMRRMHVPPIVLSSRRNRQGDDVYVCIDGKQRMTSIREFKKGNLRVTFGNSKPLRFSELHEQDQRNFDDIPVQVCIYNNIKRGDELELFSRVQNGVSLACDEKLNGHQHVDGLRNLARTYGLDKRFERKQEIRVLLCFAALMEGRAYLFAASRTTYLDRGPVSPTVLEHIDKTLQKFSSCNFDGRISFWGEPWKVTLVMYGIFLMGENWSVSGILNYFEWITTDVEKNGRSESSQNVFAALTKYEIFLNVSAPQVEEKPVSKINPKSKMQRRITSFVASTSKK